MAKPKLLSLNNYHYRRGGADTVYFEHDALLRSLGCDTAVFSMHHPSNETSEWSEYFIDELEFGARYGLLTKLRMSSKVIYSLEASKKLKRLLDHWEPDIAHAHCIYHHLSPSVLQLLKSRGIPAVMTAHDLKIACPAYKMLNGKGICEKCKRGNLVNVIVNRCVHNSLAVSALVMVESIVHKTFRLYGKNLDRVIVPSRFFANKLSEWGWPEEQLIYIPNYVDVQMYQPAYEPGDYMLYFGRLAPEKGLKTLISASVKSGIKLKIVGTGPEEIALRSYARQLRGDIEFVGFCSKDTLWPLVRESRAVVLPSEWYENAPMSLLEANALGKVVIGANIGGIPELIEHAQTGFLFESGNVDQLAESLSTTKSMSDARLSEMGRQARQHVAGKFTRNRYSEEILALYSSLGVDIPEPLGQPSLIGLSS